MTAIEGWVLNYVLNSLWQVPMVFAAIWVAVRGVRRLGVVEEHRMWCGALWMAALLPACALDARPIQQAIWRRLASWFAGGADGHATVTVAVGDGYVGQALRPSPALLHLALGLYAAIFLYALARLAWGLWQTHRLRLLARVLPQDTAAMAAWLRYRTAFGLQDADIAVVPEAVGPMTVGVHRRLLLLPETWLGSMQAEDLDAAIAHECAHMQRRDFAKNLLHRAITLPVSYHPVIWLVQAQVTESREMICDAMAADSVAGKERYARSLLRLAKNFVDCARGQNLHAIGIFDANNFERRVMNLTTKQKDTKKMQRVAIKGACAVLGFGTTVSALALRLQVATAVPQSSPQTVTFAIPRPESGEPPQSFLLDTSTAPVTMASVSVARRSPAPLSVAPVSVASVSEAPVTVASVSPAPMRIDVLTSSAVEGPQAAPGSLKVGAGVMAGNILSKVTPVYPQAAKDAKVQGAVVLNAVIGKDGSIKSLKLVSGPDELTHSAWDAVKQWTYKPYLLNGQPTEVETTITVTYQLND